MALQNGKKPVSNLSSALASIHISRDSQNNGDPALYNDYNQHNIPHYDHSINQQQYSDYDPPQNQLNIPVDRIAEYRNNPPTEGISLFSHRVSQTTHPSISPLLLTSICSLHRTDSRLPSCSPSSASNSELFSLTLRRMSSAHHTTFPWTPTRVSLPLSITTMATMLCGSLEPSLFTYASARHVRTLFILTTLLSSRPSTLGSFTRLLAMPPWLARPCISATFTPRWSRQQSSATQAKCVVSMRLSRCVWRKSASRWLWRWMTNGFLWVLRRYQKVDTLMTLSGWWEIESQ